MAGSWLLYGLDENPFEAAVLDCVHHQEDRERFGSILFSDEQERELDRQLKAAIKAASLALYVIAGPRGSGRTAFARHLVYRYAQLKGIDTAKFAFAEHDPGDNVSAPHVLHELVTLIADEARQLTGVIGQDPSPSLRAALTANPPANFGHVAVQGALREFSRTLRTAGAAFGCVLENVTIAEMLTVARKIFEKAETIVVCTVRSADRDEVVLPFENAGQPKFFEVTMPHLTPSQTWSALKHRWEKWQAISPVPLPQSAVENHIAVPPPTMGWLLSQAAMIFEHKLSSLEAGEPWPNDPLLGFSEKEVPKILQYVRKYQRSGWR